MRVAKAMTSARVLTAIREEMAGQGRYQKDLAAHLGITGKHLSMVLTGKRRMPLDMLFGTLTYLDMPLLLVGKR